jgi:hypothetical protein
VAYMYGSVGVGQGRRYGGSGKGVGGSWHSG